MFNHLANNETVCIAAQLYRRRVARGGGGRGEGDVGGPGGRRLRVDVAAGTVGVPGRLREEQRQGEVVQ